MLIVPPPYRSKGCIRLDAFDIGDLPSWYFIQSIDAPVRHIRMSSIVPTQETISRGIVQFYTEQRTARDQDGSLPYGLRFGGSRMIYLINGHHRWYAAIQKGRREFRLHVENFAETFLEACQIPQAIAI